MPRAQTPGVSWALAAVAHRMAAFRRRHTVGFGLDTAEAILVHHARSEERWRALADVVRQHRYEHARTLLETACQEAARLADYVPVLQRFLYQPT